MLTAQCVFTYVGYFLFQTQERFAIPLTVPCASNQDRMSVVLKGWTYLTLNDTVTAEYVYRTDHQISDNLVSVNMHSWRLYGVPNTRDILSILVKIVVVQASTRNRKQANLTIQASKCSTVYCIKALMDLKSGRRVIGQTSTLVHDTFVQTTKHVSKMAQLCDSNFGQHIASREANKTPGRV